MSMWKPIESAPKEPYKKLLLCKHFRDEFEWRIGWWEPPVQEDPDCMMTTEMIDVLETICGPDKGHWENRGASGSMRLCWEPTHYMEIDEPY